MSGDRPATSSALALLRADYDDQAGRSLALPVAGTLVWAAVGVVALFVEPRTAALVLVISTGAIFPIALALSRWLDERILSNSNPLGTLMAMGTLMVNLLWAVHIVLLIRAPEFLPLTLGIGLGLHWVLFSWVIGHPVGTIHAVSRTVLVTASWWAFPDYRISAVAASVVLAYLYSVCVLSNRQLNSRASAN